MNTYRHVRALARGLEVLEALNRLGTCNVADITRETGIHRTTVHRLLATLQSMGFVQQSTSEERFCLTRKVSLLSDGYAGGSQLSDIAAPIMKRLVTRVTWPSDLSVLDGDAMRVRESTHHMSPISHYRCMIDSLWPVATTANGRAYLAFCEEDQQRELIARLKRSTMPENRMVRDERYLRSVIETTRLNGYGQSFKEAEGNICAIALPVCPNGEIMGCVNLICFASAMKPAEAAERYLPELANAVAEIERGFEGAERALGDAPAIAAQPAYN